MKQSKIPFFLILMLIPTVDFFSKNIKNSHFVTSIEIDNITKNSVKLKWLSDQEKGHFFIYYNKKQVISDKLILKRSKLAESPFLEGQTFGANYSYEYEIKIKNPGTYYFAVLVEDNSDINAVSQGIADIAIPNNQHTLIPEINSTIQPTYFVKEQKKQTLPKIEEDTLIEGQVVITRLDIEETENIFKLRWFVYPKDKSHYLFKIYRSKYPISHFTSPEGLPEYARIENQFHFDDTDISVETPYYYAVVAENTNQWDLGINVFKNPAVLLRKSPLLNYEPIPEYVKKKGILNIKNEKMSEEDIQKTVKYTLRNLALSSQNTSSSICTETPIEEQINRTIVNNSDNLSKIKISGKFSTHERDAMFFVKESFLKNIEIIRNNSRKIIRDFEQKIIKEDMNEYTILLKMHKAIITEMDNLSSLEDKILSDFTIMLPSTEKLLWDRYSNGLRDIDSLKKSLKKNLSALLTLRSKRESQLNQFVSKVRSEDNTKMIQAYFMFLKEIKAEKSSEIIALNAKRIDPHSLDRQMNYEGNAAKQHNAKVAKLEKEINLISKEIELLNGRTKVFPSRFEGSIIPLKTALESVNSVMKTHANLYIFSNFKNNNNNPRLSKNILCDKMKAYQLRNKAVIGDSDWNDLNAKYANISKVSAIVEAKNALSFSENKKAMYLLGNVLDNMESWILLGKSYYFSEKYYDALSIFLLTKNAGISGSEEWIDKSLAKLNVN